MAGRPAAADPQRERRALGAVPGLVAAPLPAARRAVRLGVCGSVRFGSGRMRICALGAVQGGAGGGATTATLRLDVPSGRSLQRWAAGSTQRLCRRRRLSAGDAAAASDRMRPRGAGATQQPHTRLGCVGGPARVGRGRKHEPEHRDGVAKAAAGIGAQSSELAENRCPRRPSGPGA